MKRILPTIALCATLCAQVPGSPESLASWPWFMEIQVPHSVPYGATLLDFTLDRDMLNGARSDASDVRLYDAAGKEIPYVLRIRREVETSRPFAAREFNRSTEGNAAQASYDLGLQPQQHNQVEIDTAGDNFRRLVDVQGSSDGQQWNTLVSGAIVFRFAARGRAVEQKTVDYPVSRYRYLRIRVERDSQVDRSAPELKLVQVFRAVKMRGEIAAFPGTVESMDADRSGGRPASIWRVDFGGRIPIERLLLTIATGAFSRPFQIEDIDDPSSPTVLASGTLYRNEDNQSPQTTIDFPEHFARKVKLTVTDDRNAVLAIQAFSAQGAAREIVFEAQSAGQGPIRGYYGNYKALAPRYDLAARLPAELSPMPMRLALGPQRDNPVYRPEPLPFTERSPWLVYIVLGAASLALAVILLSLVRARAGDGTEASGPDRSLRSRL